MTDTISGVLSKAVDEMASGFGPTWDSAANWASTTDGLIELIAFVGGRVDPVHFATLLAAAAMARRQTHKANEEVGHD